jgi:hypothetical protein
MNDNNKPHLFSAGYIDDTENYDSPYFFPADVGEQEQKKVLCGYCEKPIHVDDLGGVKKGVKGEQLWFHKDCYINEAHGEL